MRTAELADVGAKGFDTTQPLTTARAEGLAAAGMRFAVRYLGSLTSAEVDTIHAAGMRVFPVTFGLKHGTPPSAILGSNFGMSSVLEMRKIGMPAGVTVWLDLEDMSGTAADIQAFVNAWATAVLAAGYRAGLYVGAGAVLTSKELYSLKVTYYWHSLSRVSDRNGAIAEPDCGWCMYQLYPSINVAGTLVDVDVIQKDYRGRLPSWCAGA